MLDTSAAITRLALGAPARHLALVPMQLPARATGRVMHLIDIENLCGTSDIRIHQAQTAMRRYHSAVGISLGDLVVVGSSHHNAFAAGKAWPGARLLVPRSGPDGADLALREVIRTERLIERFTHVHLGSGDGGFDTDLAYLAAGGVTTHVIARRGHLSRRLRIAAHHLTYLPTTFA